MKKILSLLVLTIVVLGIAISPAAQSNKSVLAASSTKTFATNYVLVNLGTATATVNASYLTPAGTVWGNSIYKSFSIPVGGNEVVRQYFDTGLTTGYGSVVISADQPVGAVVQEIVRTGTPSSAAYAGVSATNATWYVPFIARRANTATGIANSQLIIQNAGAAAADITVTFYTQGISTSIFTKTFTALASGASFLYDLEEETNLPTAWWGSAVVNTATAGGALAVIAHIFMGPDSLMAYNAVPASEVTSSWSIPLLYVRLSNTLTTSLAIQNLSGEAIAAGDIELACTNSGTVGAATFTVTNGLAVADKGVFTFNTYTDTTGFPDSNWQGACTVSTVSGKNITALVMYRYIKNAEQAAYIAVPGTITSTKVAIPYIAKKLANGYANAVTIQNLSTVPATVTLTYTGSGTWPSFTRTGVAIPANASLIRNFRLDATESPDMALGWEGSLQVTSDQAVAAYVANTYLVPTGDQFMAYLGFNQ